MIQMKAGVYGLPVMQPNGKIRIVGKGPNDGPFSVDPEREAELVKKGIARYVEQHQEEGKQHDPDHEQNQEENDGTPIGFDEMPPEDFVEDAEDEADVVEEIIDLETLTVNELRELGKEYGLTFKANTKKADMIEAITEAQAQIAEDGEDAPTFDAAEAVEE